MCGIAGIINKNNAPFDQNQLKAMSDLMQHRGPEAQGFHIHENVDLSTTDSQCFIILKRIKY